MLEDMCKAVPMHVRRSKDKVFIAGNVGSFGIQLN